nr:hypothetical protein [Haloferax sp. ATB1]
MDAELAGDGERRATGARTSTPSSWDIRRTTRFRSSAPDTPTIPASWSRGGESLTEPEREQFNDLLWDYCERVRRYVQDEVNEFVGVAGVPEE